MAGKQEKFRAEIDLRKPHAQTYGVNPYRYTQDGKYFSDNRMECTAAGEPVFTEPKKGPAADPGLDPVVEPDEDDSGFEG